MNAKDRIGVADDVLCSTQRVAGVLNKTTHQEGRGEGSMLCSEEDGLFILLTVLGSNSII